MSSDDIKLEAHCAPCFNFLREGKEEKKTVWLVPHVIRHTHNEQIITWRCSLGHLCEAGCLYARAKGD